MTRPSAALQGQRVYLCAQDGEKDAAIYASWTHDSEAQRFLDSDPARPRTAAFWREALGRAENPNFFAFAVHTLADDRLYRVGGAVEAALIDRWGHLLIDEAPEM